jgi:hypothetical protein
VADLSQKPLPFARNSESQRETAKENNQTFNPLAAGSSPAALTMIFLYQA